MKNTFLILFLSMIPLINYGQEAFQSNQSKNQFSIQVGGYYKTFLGGKYIEPKVYKNENDFRDHQYEGFDKFSTTGLSAGFLFSFRFHNRLGITTGLIYFLRKELFSKNQNDLINSGSASSMRDIRNVFKYDYSLNNIEFPIMVQHTLRRFTFYAGSYFAVLTYKIAKYDYIVYNYLNNPPWTTADKEINGFELLLKLFPTIQIGYEVKILNNKMYPYLAFYYAIKNKSDLYIQLGINSPLSIKKK